MTLRIGIPRSLHFYQHYPAWRTFFEAFGAEVVVSPPTNRDILSAGAKVVADVTCLPVKVYAGHVIWLRDNGHVDFVFAPAMRNILKDAFHCAKFQALPDIMKATVADCPPLLDIEMDLERRRVSEQEAFYRLGRRFTWNPLKVRRAWAYACQVDKVYRRMMVAEQLTYPQALARLYGSECKSPPPSNTAASALTIGMVGHPYCLYDDYINHDLILHLRALGVNILTSEMVSPEDAQAGIQQTAGKTLWFYESCMSGAAGHFLHAPGVGGLITVLAFACGPDSTMVETITRHAHALGRSCLNLVLDEHGSAAGMLTRLEAFVDMLARQKSLPPRSAPPPPPKEAAAPSRSAPVVLREVLKPVLGIPTMGTTIIPIKSLFRGIGAHLELGPRPSSRTVALGVR